METEIIYQDKSDRRSSRQVWLKELRKINFIEDYEFETEDDYGEESYP